VTWKPLVKNRPVLARSFLLALLFLFCAAQAGSGAEPTGATVTLQLPPSMSPETVKALIADLAAKGAQPATATADPPESTVAPALMTGMKSAAQIWAATKQAIRAVPVVWQTPQVLGGHVEAEGGTRVC